MDVVEIGSRALEQGGVYPVKPLGVYAMIDDGELDWKVRGSTLGAGKSRHILKHAPCTGAICSGTYAVNQLRPAERNV